MEGNNMSCSNLKALANLAKQRLRNAGISNGEKYNTVNDINKNSYFYKNFVTLKKVSGGVEYVPLNNDEDYAFIDKVFTLLREDEDILNPISKLTDTQKYNTLSSAEKEKYILTLADKYQKAREMYFKDKVKHIL